MSSDASYEREVRAARNQVMFRAVNERMQQLRDKFTQVLDDNVAVCECSDHACVGIVHIGFDTYLAVRASPRTFVVLPGHVDPSVERAVEITDRYVVVENVGIAGEIAEATDLRPSPTGASPPREETPPSWTPNAEPGFSR